MKNSISCIILLLLFTGINAQEAKTAHITQDTEKLATATTDSSDSITALKTENNLEDYTCYSELSKVAFYEALLRKNNLDVSTKSDTLILENTENNILDNKNQISVFE
ncbi:MULTISPECIES: hypothetical protein [Aquimarina]|uniref:hypothetical protein n=1 Tax=Aquimarina TaxID=290174 RepID=UPI000CDEC1B6|nr:MULTISPECIES: hypothetical protein [Aquimarina]